MKTVGYVLKTARMSKDLSLGRIESAIKIKKEFIEALEKEDWDNLPEFPVVSGFVKNYADFLGCDKNATLALLRRDYPPKKLFINPKPDVEKKFSINPKITFITGIALVILSTIVYLSIQYSKYMSPPELTLVEPAEGQIVNQRKLTVLGKTEKDATVIVNNQPVLVDEEGNFALQINIISDTKEIVVSAKSRAGKETVIRRNINPEL